MEEARTDVHVSSHPDRVFSLAAGGALLFFGIRARGPLGYGLAAVGAGLFYAGVKGQPSLLRALMSFGEAAPWHRGVRVHQTITINKPVSEIYNFWRNFENLAAFMKHLELVNARDDQTSFWVAKAPGGGTVEWEAQIVQERENEFIAWHTVPGSDIEHWGVVYFKNAGDEGTEISVTLEYSAPAGALGAAVAKLLGEEPEIQIEEDLRRLKEMIEGGELATAKAQAGGGRKPKPVAKTDVAVEDSVEEASQGSFPASDPPGWSEVTTGPLVEPESSDKN